jgi:hypothetical protein
MISSVCFAKARPSMHELHQNEVRRSFNLKE